LKIENFAALADLADYLGIEPCEIVPRLRDAANRTRPFYKDLLENYATFEKIYPTSTAELKRQRDRLYRLGVVPPEISEDTQKP
jgi:hypothetical protein